MQRIHRLAALLSIAGSVWAAEFQTGQAARAVIGQSSFSSRETGITPFALSLANGRLYAADTSRRVLTFDATQIPGPKDDVSARPDSTCALCGFSPIAAITQPVSPSAAAVAFSGKTVVVADTSARRVLIWRDSSSPRAAKGPDIVLGRTNSDPGTVSASTLIEPISVAFDGRRLFVGDGALHRVLIWNSIPASDSQPADAVLGQPNLSSANVNEVPGSDTIGRPAALVSDGLNLFVADSAEHRILVFTAADATLANNAVANAASLAPGPLAPGTLITIGGSNLSNANESAPEDGSQPLPRSLGGVEVFLNGMKVPLLSVSPSQLRAQLPYDLDEASSMSLYVRTESSDGAVAITNAVAVKVLPATPGLFAFGGNEPRAGMILHANGSSGQPATPVTADDPAKPGEVLILWAAGLGAVDDSGGTEPVSEGEPHEDRDTPVVTRVSALVGGQPVELISATLPKNSIGIYEVRVQLPVDLPTDSKTQVLISQNGQISNTVIIPVEGAVQ